MNLDIDGMQIPVAVVYNGKKMWRTVNDKTDEIKDEKTLSETREALLAEGGGSFVDYLKAPYELGSLGEVKVKDKDRHRHPRQQERPARRQLVLRQEDAPARQDRDAGPR